MIRQRSIEFLGVILVLTAFVLQACSSQASLFTPSQTLSPTPISTLTFTPKPPTALPTATLTPTITLTPTFFPSMTPVPVIYTVSGGNLSLRRGPGFGYNFVGALYDGEAALAVGRTFEGDWLLVEIPSNPGATGWAPTETKYATVTGDRNRLPFFNMKPPDPAFIRNCTAHPIWLKSIDLQLYEKSRAPFNQAELPVAVYTVYDLGVEEIARLDDIILGEGMVVDIIFDGNGDESHCN